MLVVKRSSSNEVLRRGTERRALAPTSTKRSPFSFMVSSGQITYTSASSSDMNSRRRSLLKKKGRGLILYASVCFPPVFPFLSYFSFSAESFFFSSFISQFVFLTFNFCLDVFYLLIQVSCRELSRVATSATEIKL